VKNLRQDLLTHLSVVGTIKRLYQIVESFIRQWLARNIRVFCGSRNMDKLCDISGDCLLDAVIMCMHDAFSSGS
jgi:hypothetical protein